MSQKNIRMGVGVFSAIFLVLALVMTALAVLGFSDANGDLALTKRSEEMTRNYYAAVARSERALAGFDAALAEGRSAGEAAEAAGGTLRDGEAEFRFDAGAGRELVLIVRPTEQEADGKRCKIVSRTLNTAQEEDGQEEYLPVYQGTEEHYGTD